MINKHIYQKLIDAVLLAVLLVVIAAAWALICEIPSTLLKANAFEDAPWIGELEEARRLAPKYAAEAEVRLLDNTRVDLLSNEYAFEIDRAPHWAEAVGQAMHYAILADRQPAIILLLENPDTEWQHLVRAAMVCGKIGIQLYVEPISRGEP